MENENKEDGQMSESQEADLQDNDERKPGVLGRVRGAFGSAGQGVTGAVDTVTGAGFRKDFEDFTEAVTTTVIGVHQDQAALRESISRLEQTSLQEHTALSERLSQHEAGVERELTELKDGLSRLEQRSPMPRWVLASGVASLLALGCSVAALIMSL